MGHLIELNNVYKIYPMGLSLIHISMAAERDDLDRYLDLFGTHPKYGLSGRKIASVTYRPQPYRRTVPLYELP